MILLLLNLFLFIFILLFAEQFIHRYFLLNKYKITIELLDYFLNKSYGVIYNDQIIGYASDGYKVIPDDELETIERNFVKLTFELMGSNNAKLFILFFGSRVVLIDNMILYMRREIEQDTLADMVQKHKDNHEMAR